MKPKKNSSRLAANRTTTASESNTSKKSRRRATSRSPRKQKSANNTSQSDPSLPSNQTGNSQNLKSTGRRGSRGNLSLPTSKKAPNGQESDASSITKARSPVKSIGKSPSDISGGKGNHSEDERKHDSVRNIEKNELNGAVESLVREQDSPNDCADSSLTEQHCSGETCNDPNEHNEMNKLELDHGVGKQTNQISKSTIDDSVPSDREVSSTSKRNKMSSSKTTTRYPSRSRRAMTVAAALKNSPTHRSRKSHSYQVLTAVLPTGETTKVRISLKVSSQHKGNDNNLNEINNGDIKEISSKPTPHSRKRTSTDDSTNTPSPSTNSMIKRSPNRSGKPRRVTRSRRISTPGNHNESMGLHSSEKPDESPSNPSQMKQESSSKKITPQQNFLGDDGNLYYCHICLDVGDVVCCDGCPKVFHPTCIPSGCASRKSLEADEDPWYCPSCFEKEGSNNRKQDEHPSTEEGNKMTISVSVKEEQTESSQKKVIPKNPVKDERGPNASTRTRRRSRGKQRCAECQQVGGGLPMEACTGCGALIHVPSCRYEDSPEIVSLKIGLVTGTKVLCTNCRAEDVVKKEEGDRLMTGSSVESKRNNDTHQENASCEAPKANSDDVSSLSTPPPSARNVTRLSGRRRQRRLPSSVSNDEKVIKASDELMKERRTKRTRSLSPSLSKINQPDKDAKKHKEIEIENENNSRLREKKTETKRKILLDENNDRKNKKKKRMLESEPELPSNLHNIVEESKDEINDSSIPQIGIFEETKKSLTAERPVKATPPFFFYLADNRIKLERYLAKQDRNFKRTVKGFDRNLLVAREGLKWWENVESKERRQFLDIAIQDFENRIIIWKEEENVRAMIAAHEELERKKLHTKTENKTVIDLESTKDDHQEIDDNLVSSNNNEIPNDDVYWYLRRRRLLSSSQIECKPVSHIPTGNSNNSVLLEVLQDIRFHPLPMIYPDRPLTELDFPDYSRMTIPYFSVQGPVSTSVGDSCLGCIRGWNHFCPVLQRQFPAVEHRAKLQPPVSSLLATRIGLGLPLDDTNEVVVFSPPEYRVVDSTGSPNNKQFTPVPNFYLNQPSTRADDIVHFIEETIAVKYPPLETQSRPQAATSKILARGTLPTRGKKKRDQLLVKGGEISSKSTNIINEDTESSKKADQNRLYECGRCGTLIPFKYGCITCRRAKLIVETAKRQPVMATTVSTRLQGNSEDIDSSTSYGAGFLKLQTVMLGRPNLRLSNFEQQKDGDRAIANAMTNMQWKPNIVMTPQLKILPSANPKSTVTLSDDDYSSSNLVSDSSLKEIDDCDLEVDEIATEETKRNHETLNNRSEAVTKMREKPKVQTVPETHTSTRTNARNRTTRSTVLASKSSVVVDGFLESRQEVAEAHKEEVNELQRRCLSIATCGILLGMLRRDPMRLFSEPVPNDVDCYDKIVLNPIDFSEIKRKVLASQYSSLGAFVSDARLLCKNALAYNPQGTIYSKTAKEILDSLELMQKRASNWTSAVKNAHASYFARFNSGTNVTGRKIKWPSRADKNIDGNLETITHRYPFVEDLQKTWPGAAELLDDLESLRAQLASDFIRTRENENAYYGTLAIRRTAIAAEVSVTKMAEDSGTFAPSVCRSYLDDEALRNHIDNEVGKVNGPIQLKEHPTMREQDIMRLLRRVQARRVENRTSSDSGCARCDGVKNNEESKLAMAAEAMLKKKKKREIKSRVPESRLHQATGLASKKARTSMNNEKNMFGCSDIKDLTFSDVSVCVQGSKIHGWGLFADRPFKKGEIVAEYVGEYITNAVADAREKNYQEKRIQDYQFRLNVSLVIDATQKGGHARYINHSCNPNCIAKIVDGEPPNERLKRVIVVCERDIEAKEEISYDYQFPLELDFISRISCHCGSSKCRGFMNWDLPESGAQALRYAKRNKRTKTRLRKVSPKKEKKSSKL